MKPLDTKSWVQHEPRGLVLRSYVSQLPQEVATASVEMRDGMMQG